jgi:hypothetical protein
VTDPDPDPGDATDKAVEPSQDEVPKITLSKKVATELKETVLVKRRPVSRPRRE